MTPPEADNAPNASEPGTLREANEAWTDLDLAAYLDAEMSPGQAASLASALRVDPPLRDRLMALRAADAAVLAFASAQSVESLTSGSRSRGPAGPRLLPIGLALVATVALALTVWVVLGPPHASSNQRGQSSRIAAEPAVEGSLVSDPTPFQPAFADGTSERVDVTEGRASMIRVSLGTVRPRPGTSMSRQAGPPAPGAGLPRALPLRTSGAGTIGASPTLRATVAADRWSEDPMLIIARGVRSREEGLAVLELLDPAGQARACAVWARETRTRPIAFEQLAQLARDPAGAADARRVIGLLSAREEFVPWLRMHGLLPEQPAAATSGTMQ